MPKQHGDLPVAAETDKAWAAGYLEGDGSFRLIPDSSTIQVRAWSNDPEPLERLQRLFGGRIGRSKVTTAGNTSWEWWVLNEEARAVIRAVTPWLSHRRLQQIIGATTQGSTHPAMRS